MCVVRPLQAEPRVFAIVADNSASELFQLILSDSKLCLDEPVGEGA